MGRQVSQEPTFQVIVAATSMLAIGRKGGLPWRLPGDMAYFKEVTTRSKSACIMGRKTWESIPLKFRPLAGRKNIVLSSTPQDCTVCSSFEEALTAASDCEEIFIIGGAQLYEVAVADPRCKRVYLTSVDADVEADAFFPVLRASDYALTERSKPMKDGDVSYRFEVYDRVATHQEDQYLTLVRKVITQADRPDRTGVGTRSLFGASMRFDLRRGFPLLTTKRVFWRGVAEELLWFLRGSTNANDLAAKNVRIWDDNGSKEFLEKRGLPYDQGDLGPVYGFQWRHFGASYQSATADYTGQGVDQLKAIISAIKNDPFSRRIVMSAWNPADLDKMALPPCHMFCQFYVSNNELSCQMYQRSADLGLGVPFNIASYALLTCLLAHVTGLQVGDFVHVIGDAHVYQNHIGPLRRQLLRAPRPFPTLTINPDKTDIESFTIDDLTITDYNPHPKIAMDMAV